MEQQADADLLKKELYGLFKYLQRVRLEIAAINRPADEALHFDSMSDQLDAIVKATEEATDTIMVHVTGSPRIIETERKYKGPAPLAGPLYSVSASGGCTGYQSEPGRCIVAAYNPGDRI